jgi:hypothetical protein
MAYMQRSDIKGNTSKCFKSGAIKGYTEERIGPDGTIYTTVTPVTHVTPGEQTFMTYNFVGVKKFNDKSGVKKGYIDMTLTIHGTELQSRNYFENVSKRKKKDGNGSVLQFVMCDNICNDVKRVYKIDYNPCIMPGFI